MRLIICLAAIVLPLAGKTLAANPAAIQLGQQLFTQPFSPLPLTPAGDGLGPLFNHVSCVACHHSGGVGGAGDHRFNARTFAIQQLRFNPQATRQNLTQAIRSINPLLLGPGGSLNNVIVVPRHGGSVQFNQFRNSLIAGFNPSWDHAERHNSDGVRAERAGQIVGDSSGALAIQGHLLSRNTTALFGAGLIDRIPDAAILQQAKVRKRFPEIQGRPATLADGRLGKFGWRANFASLLEFNENACVNELGLQTKRVPQLADSTNPGYQNPAVDIDDAAIAAMTQFVAALPAPTRAAPVDSYHQAQIALGEQRFAAIGCATCHAPNLGPVKGIYSDLLLHDMGPTSIDYSSAEPYRKTYDYDYEEDSFVAGPSNYHGVVAPIQAIDLHPQREFIFTSPERPSKTVTVPIKLGLVDDQLEIQGPAKFKNTLVAPNQVLRLKKVVSSETIPTNITREWRTPPLWGVRDSAPYMHDGRAETLLEAIGMHEGSATRTRNRFFELSYEEQLAVVAFLESLVAPTQGVIPAPKDFTQRQLASN